MAASANSEIALMYTDGLRVKSDGEELVDSHSQHVICLGETDSLNYIGSTLDKKSV